MVLNFGFEFNCYYWQIQQDINNDLYEALRNFNRGVMVSTNSVFDVLVQRLCIVRVSVPGHLFCVFYFNKKSDRCTVLLNSRFCHFNILCYIKRTVIVPSLGFKMYCHAKEQHLHNFLFLSPTFGFGENKCTQTDVIHTIN